MGVEFFQMCCEGPHRLQNNMFFVCQLGFQGADLKPFGLSNGIPYFFFFLNLFGFPPKAKA